MDATESPFSNAERRAVAAFCLMAAHAAGLRDEERARLGELFEELGGVDTARLYRDVLLGRVELGEAAPGADAPPGPPDLGRTILNRAILAGGLDLPAVAGVGLTSQVLEGYARKRFGGAVRKLGGKTAGKLRKTATSALTTFATTYAVGKALFDRYQGQVRERASTTSLPELTRQLRG